MEYLKRYGWPAGLAIGLAAGLMLSGLWPHTPLHAVATDRKDTFAIATGFVDEGIEAVYYLDFLTGSLRAGVLSQKLPVFQAMYETNVNADLQRTIAYLNNSRRGAPAGAELQLPATPNYIMVTGMNQMPGTSGPRRASLSTLYVAETNTGVVLAYVIPWSRGAHSAGQQIRDVLQLRAADQFSSAVLRTK